MLQRLPRVGFPFFSEQVSKTPACWSRHRLCGSVLLLTISLLAGCSKETEPMGTVLGVVTVQGEVPADGLQLSLFNPMTGRGARSKTEKDGSFRMNRPLPVGNYKMLIDQMVPEEPEPDNKPDSNKMQIDSAYANDQTTPLEFEVVRGENTLQIDLKGPSARKSSSR